jgi:hypothetical protein
MAIWILSKHNCGAVMDNYFMLTGDVLYNIGGLAIVFRVIYIYIYIFTGCLFSVNVLEGCTCYIPALVI